MMYIVCELTPVQMNNVNDSSVIDELGQGYFDSIRESIALDYGHQDDVHVLREIIRQLREMDTNYHVNGHLCEESRQMLRDNAHEMTVQRREYNMNGEVVPFNDQD